MNEERRSLYLSVNREEDGQDRRKRRRKVEWILSEGRRDQVVKQSLLCIKVSSFWKKSSKQVNSASVLVEYDE